MNETIQSMDLIVKLLESQFIPKILISLVIILVLLFIRWLVLRAINTYFHDVRIRYTWRKWTTHIGFLLSAILIISVWFKEFSSVLTFLGLLSAGIAIALREPVVNFFGWVFLLWRKPFSVGDRIKIGDDTGDVIDIRIFQFSLMEVGAWVGSDQYTGRVIDVPNGKVFSYPQYNFSKQFPLIWNELSFRVTFDSNIEKAKQLIFDSISQSDIDVSTDDTDKLKDVIENFVTYNVSTEPAVYYKVVENGIQFTFRYLCRFNRRRLTEQMIWEKLIDKIFKDDKVKFAYPTQKFIGGIDSQNSSNDNYNIV
ncbi:MAG: mechanosensitive ion channel [Candidatus Kapabacteria bacterium]|nr:mechanosensitive ion channel [Ignavibacteriota bacterium]MCW5884654.1 mechanosensitive ion channel [Candidatus Kapabacteria bacterium]